MRCRYDSRSHFEHVENVATSCLERSNPRATDGVNKDTTPLTTERIFWHCGAHTAEPKAGTCGLIPPIPYYQCLLFSVARGGRLLEQGLRNGEESAGGGLADPRS